MKSILRLCVLFASLSLAHGFLGFQKKSFPQEGLPKFGGKNDNDIAEDVSSAEEASTPWWEAFNESDSDSDLEDPDLGGKNDNGIAEDVSSAAEASESNSDSDLEEPDLGGKNDNGIAEGVSSAEEASTPWWEAFDESNSDSDSDVEEPDLGGKNDNEIAEVVSSAEESPKPWWEAFDESNYDSDSDVEQPDLGGKDDNDIAKDISSAEEASKPWWEAFDESNSDSDSDLKEPIGLAGIDPTVTKKTNSKRKKCDDTTSHYHCYCLRSTVSEHQKMQYIGFTTNPEHRLKQHNGILKNGGARYTKRGGRPWEFVVLVTGFTSRKKALKFEWAWQRPGRSLLVRAAIGNDAAKKLQSKRGPHGKMCALKTILEHCPDLYDWKPITLYFLQPNGKEIYDDAISTPALPESVIAANLLSIKQPAHKRKILSRASDAIGLPPPPPRQKVPDVSARMISSLSEMPFWASENQKLSSEK